MMKLAVFLTAVSLIVSGCAAENQYGEDGRSRQSEGRNNQTDANTESTRTSGENSVDSDSDSDAVADPGKAKDPSPPRNEDDPDLNEDTNAVVSIRAFSNDTQLPVGGSGFQLSVEGTTKGYETVDLAAKDIQWTLPEKYNGFAEVTESGLLKAFEKGKFEVNASYQGKTATVEVEAIPAEVVSLHFGCRDQAYEKFAGCKEQNLDGCSAGMQLFDLKKGIELDAAVEPKTVHFPVFITGYRSDCTVVDLTAGKGVDLVSNFPGLVVGPDQNSIYSADHAVRLEYINRLVALELTAYYVTESGRTLSVVTPFNYKFVGEEP